MNLDRLTLPREVRDRLALGADELVDAGIAVRARGRLAEARRAPQGVEVRANADGSVHVTGYATTWDTQYEVAGGPPWGWVESIGRGAAAKSLAENDDVRFLINHDGLPLARTKSGTLKLTSDDVGLLADAPELDMDNPDVQQLRSALERRDVDQMSFAFLATRQEWNDDYTERRILEVRLFDVSAVTYPANEATIIALRDRSVFSDWEKLPTPAARGGYPLGLALAELDILSA